MAEAFINVQIVEELALPYESGAEQWLDDWLATAWQDVAMAFPGLRLDPLFSAIDEWTLADIVDVGRMLGDEPPNPFAWFEIPCDDAFAEQLLALVQNLPFVEFAELRDEAVPAGVVSFGTNPEILRSFQIGPAPFGVDAIYAWQVPGGTGPGMRVCDIEDNWDLGHEDLLTANIERFSTFGAGSTNHGTAVMGIVMGSDNGVGLVGIAPEALGFLVTQRRNNGVSSIPSALAAAALAAQPGGVVLIELAQNFAAGQSEPAIPVEFSRPTQVAIGLLTAAGVNVIEPAGNRGTDLDAFPFFGPLQPGHPAFVDSGAVMVGGANLVGIEGREPGWTRASTHGARVDCFAAFSLIRAPDSSAFNAYQNFGGTSGASAIIAGLVCAIQGMSRANSGQLLLPSDIRRLLRDPALGTPTTPGLLGGVGSMPDLRRIAHFMGWPRIMPSAAMAIADDGVFLVQIADDDRLSRRPWSRLTGLLPHLPFPDPTGRFHMAAQTPAVMVTLELEPLLRTVFELVVVGNDGSLHYGWWDTLGNVGDLSAPRSAELVVAAGHDIAAVHPTVSILAVAAISPEGRLIFMIDDAAVSGPPVFTDPFVVDPAGSYRILSGPILLSRRPGELDLVAIDDGGNLRWASGNVLATIGTGWDAFLTADSAVPMDPRCKPGVAGSLDGVAIVALGSDALLYYCAFQMAPIMFENLNAFVGGTRFAAAGQIGLAISRDETLVMAAVGEDGLIYFSFRRIAMGSNWSPLRPIDPDVRVSPLGGVTVVTQGPGIMVFAVLPDGRPCRSDFISGIGWLPLSP